jgi:hypothetical protein
MLKEISKSDIIIRPFKVYKEWTLDENDVPTVYGANITNSVFDPSSDPKSNGLYQRLVYDSIAAQFYLNSATASLFTEVGHRKSYTSTDERNIGNNIAVISIPQIYFGEGIKVGSVLLNDGVNDYIDDGYSNLIYNNEIYGNIFYDRGLIVMTKNIINGSSFLNYSLYFRSTKTIYENEIFISVLENEFNTSTNPSSYYEDGGSSFIATLTNPNDPTLTQNYTKIINQAGIRYIRNSKFPFTSSLNPIVFASFDDYFESGSLDPTGSYLAPYITTIALYDDELNMVAVAKLPKAVKSLPDYPVNFIVRFDT